MFIPVAFLGGISGQIYRQFAVTIAVSVLLSAFNALSLSPALSAILLRPHKKHRGPLEGVFSGFNRGFEWSRGRYMFFVGKFTRRFGVALLSLAIFTAAAAYLFRKLPTGFLPDEDQGVMFTSVRLPDGASSERTNAATAKIENLLMKDPAVSSIFSIGGMDIRTSGGGSNVSTVIVTLKPWEERTAPELQLRATLARFMAKFATVPEAQTVAFGLPPIMGLSVTGGFQYVLEDRMGGTVEDLARTADGLIDASRQKPEIASVLTTFYPHVPGYRVDTDVAKLQSVGVPLGDAYSALQTFLGGLYVNDFNLFGRTWQVVIQAQPQFRSKPTDFEHFYVRTNDGRMAPLGTFATLQATATPDVIYRYNRNRAIQLQGSPAPGRSSGEAVRAMEEVSNNLPPGYAYEWTGTTYQEKLAQGSEGIIFGFAAVLVFLFLAALYESWTIPLAVLFALPLGVFGALAAVAVRGYPYDIYTQIGIVTLIGLAAKNAILIVEFARERHASGMSARDAAMEAARLRLRPILMTSFAFILGVSPLVIASGASSASRRSLGTAVFGGMLSATLLAIFIVPTLFVVVQRIFEGKARAESAAASKEAEQ